MKKHLTQFNTPDVFAQASVDKAYDVPNVSFIKTTKEVKYNENYPAPHGASILMKDGKFYTATEFTEKGFTESSALGVFINDTTENPARTLLIFPYLSNTTKWAEVNENVPGVSGSTDIENGYANTVALFKHYPNHYLKDFVFNAFDDDNILGYIPSYKELHLIGNWLTEVNECLNVMGFEDLDMSTPYLSSTQDNDDDERYLTYDGSGVAEEPKSNENPCIVVAKLDDEEQYQ